MPNAGPRTQTVDGDVDAGDEIYKGRSVIVCTGSLPVVHSVFTPTIRWLVGAAEPCDLPVVTLTASSTRFIRLLSQSIAHLSTLPFF